MSDRLSHERQAKEDNRDKNTIMPNVACFDRGDQWLNQKIADIHMRLSLIDHSLEDTINKTVTMKGMAELSLTQCLKKIIEEENVSIFALVNNDKWRMLIYYTFRKKN